MTYCKANSCYNSINYSWNNYCSYHERCLSKLREFDGSTNGIERGKIQEIETFTTWFNGNCGWIVTYDYSASSYPYYVWIVVYEPATKSINERLSAIRHGNYGSLSSARDKAQELRRKLQSSSWSGTPMLEVHSHTNSYESFNYLTNGDYVRKTVLPHETKRENYGSSCTCYPDCPCFHCRCSDTSEIVTHTLTANPERYLKPLDVVKVSEGFYEHFGVYLGKINGEYKVCNFSKKYKGTWLHSLNRFLSDYQKGSGEVTACHPMIPFKYYEKIARQIAWANDVDFRANNYNLSNRNCEHFANMIVYGINYSQQIENNKATIDTGKVANSFLAGLTLGFSLIATGTHENATNNNKGSTIKLINEMQESDDKLGWRTNDLSRDIESQYRQEIPPKQNCRIM